MEGRSNTREPSPTRESGEDAYEWKPETEQLLADLLEYATSKYEWDTSSVADFVPPDEEEAEVRCSP